MATRFTLFYTRPKVSGHARVSCVYAPGILQAATLFYLELEGCDPGNESLDSDPLLEEALAGLERFQLIGELSSVGSGAGRAILG